MYIKENERGNLAIEGSPYTFLGLPSGKKAFDNARVVILPVPYDGTTTFVPGTREGPRAIIMASRELELYDEEMEIEPCKWGIYTLPEIPLDVSSPWDMIQKVKHVGLSTLENGKLPVMLGGEHLMSLGLILAFKDFFQKRNITVLHLDAHADLKDEYQNSHYSNACAMRRVCEFFPLVSVGVRSLTREEHEFARNELISLYFAGKLNENPKLWEKAADNLSEYVYITMDLDVFDPSIMPSVGTPEPGGLGWYEILRFLKNVCATRKVVGFDIMELRPTPGMIAPDFLAARLLYKILAYIFSHTP